MKRNTTLLLTDPFTGKFLLFIWILVLVGCGGDEVIIDERPLPKRNLTAYEFNVSIDSVKTAITEARGENWRDNQKLNKKGNLAWEKDRDPFAESIFVKRENENDAYLYGICDAVGESRVYYKDGKGLTYYADFHIHITPINASKTRVEIFTHNSRVLAGTEWHPFVKAGTWAQVEATSIEEYQILLDIGEQLGVQDMPKITMPDPNSRLRKVKKMRPR